MRFIVLSLMFCVTSVCAAPYNHETPADAIGKSSKDPGEVVYLESYEVIYERGGQQSKPALEDLLPLGVYVEGDTGFGFQSLDSDGLTEVSERLHLGVGLKLYEFLYVGFGVNGWFDYEAEDETEDDKNTGVTFSGWSTGFDARLHLIPGDTSPYVRFGHHCWSASVGGLLSPWEKEGCSNYWGGGLNIISVSRNNGKKTSVYGEILQISFEDVEAINLVLGFRL